MTYIIEVTHRDLIRAIKVWGEAWAAEGLVGDIYKAQMRVNHLWLEVEQRLDNFEEAATQAGYEAGSEEVLTAEKGPA